MIILNIFTSLVRTLILLILPMLVIIQIFLLTTITTFGNIETVKDWPEQAGSYNSLVDSLFELIELDSREESDKSVSAFDVGLLNKEGIVDVVKSAYDADFLKSQANGFFDGSFAWLEQKTEIPEFELTLKDRAPQFIKALTVELKTQYSTLPTCKQNQLTPTFDLLEAKCLPAGTDLDTAIKEFTDQLVKGKDAPLTSVLTGEEILSNPEAGDSELAKLPEVYKLANTAVAVLPVLIVILGALVLATSRYWRKGLSRVGGAVFSGGVTGFISFFIARLAINASDQLSFTGAEGKVFKTILEPLLTVVIEDVSSVGIRFSVITMVIGAGCWIGGMWLNRRHKEVELKDKALAGGLINDDPELNTSGLDHLKEPADHANNKAAGVSHADDKPPKTPTLTANDVTAPPSQKRPGIDPK